MAKETDTEELDSQLDMPIITEEDELEMGLDDYEGGKTLTEAEEESPHQSDLQAVLKKLHPKFKNKRQDDLLQPIMSSRIFPDNHLDLNYFLSMYLIEECEGDDDIDVLAIITGNQAGTSIAYEGRGRVEDLEVAGVAHEEEMEKLSKELGLA